MEAKKKYTFGIFETFSEEVSVEATSEEEARKIVEEMYESGKIDVECFMEYSIELVGMDLCDSEWGKR